MSNLGWNKTIKYLGLSHYTPAQWNYLVNNYYNEYYATEADTQRRRQERNLRNNNRSIQLANKNPFIQNHQQSGTTTYFFYMNTYNYKYIVYQPDANGKRKVNAFVFINGTGVWCNMGFFELQAGQTLAEYVQLCYVSKEGEPPYFIGKNDY